MKLNFQNTPKRTIRIFFLIIYIVIFFVTAFNALSVLYLNAIGNDECAWREIPGRKDAYLITDVVEGGVTDKAGVKNGDILLKINGENINTDARNAISIVNSVARGGSVDYVIERDGNIFRVKVDIVRVFDVVFFANYLFGLVFFVVGFILVTSRPDGIVQRMFAYFSALLMLSGNNLRIVFQFTPNWVSDIFFGISLALFAIVFINFVYLFPVHRDRKNIRWVLGILLLIIFFCYVINIFQRDQPNRPQLLIFLLGNSGLIIFITGLIIFAHSYFKYVEPNKRKPLRPVLISALVTVAAFVYTIYLNNTNSFLIFIKPSALIPGVLIVAFPIAFGYSIFKYKLMDTALVIKKSIVYGVITTTIAGIYLMIVFGVGSFISSYFGKTQNTALSFVALIVIAIVFDPLKRALQDSVDRVFYRERYNYQKALLEFSRMLPFKMNIDGILDSVVNTISSTMHIDKMESVILDGKEIIQCFSKNIPDEYLTYNSDTAWIIEILQTKKAPVNVSTLYDEKYFYIIPDEELKKLTNADIQLIIPMIANNKVIGFINIGPKLSGKSCSQEDIDLLFTVANQAAIAIESSRLYENEKTLYKVQEEIRLASKIQSEWIPKSSPVIPGFDVSGITLPAKVVGGDYFDFIEIDNSSHAFCIGDVSGKGLPAALMMGNTQAILRSQALSAASASLCVERTNRLISDNSTDEMFVTLFYGILEIKSRKFTFSNAGHNYPYLISSSKTTPLSEGGLPLGVQKNSIYIENSVKFSQNDLLVMYTDGITETFNNSAEEYGDERLLQVIDRFKNEDAKTIMNKIIDDVNSFKQEQPVHDDMTVVVIKCVN